MNENSNENKGWVLVNIDGFIMVWSFHYTRNGAIKKLISGGSKTWKQWYREGIRCVKATRKITIDL